MLSDSYVEQALKAKPRGNYYGKLALAVIITLFGAGSVLFAGLIGLVIMIIGIALFSVFVGEKNLEYEYILTNGSVEIAAIYNGSKRKELMCFELDQVTMIVPKNSQRIETEKFAKKRDYSSHIGDGQVIAIVLELNNRRELVEMEPDERTLAHIKAYARMKMYDIA